MKKLIAAVIAGTFATVAFAQAPAKKDEKAPAKAEAKKDEKKAAPKKDEKKAEAKKYSWYRLHRGALAFR
ncbi:MAG: hypothetical protein ACK44X_01520 [Burkholderiales bacterium]